MNFLQDNAECSLERHKQDFSLCYVYPKISDNQQANIVLVKNNKNLRKKANGSSLTEDGLYVSNNPLKYNVTKPYPLSRIKLLDYKTTTKFYGTLLEIVIRNVEVYNSDIQVNSVAILFKNKVICKVNSPFNRKLHKILLRNVETANLSMQVHCEDGQSSILPLPLPKHSVKDSKVNIEFAINDNSVKILTGTITYTISLAFNDESEQKKNGTFLYKLSNDPNDPQNSLALPKSQKTSNKQVKYFLLEDPTLQFPITEENIFTQKAKTQDLKSPDIVTVEQPMLSILEISFKNLFQARRPLRPSSSIQRHHIVGRALLSIVILRGVEVPLREESASVQPVVEVEWDGVINSTNVADGPAPIWQEMMHFELSRQNNEHDIKLRLYDQHPIWGQQWLGEARIPFEYYKNYQELEHWVALSSLHSPALLFGYVQASPGRSHTRIYILMKMELPSNLKSREDSTINTLLKNIQRCLTSAHKINGIETPEDAARLAMLLPDLPDHYGPLTPHQALNINKVDRYGRAALLATLLEAFDLQTYVLLGSSQTNKWSAFVLTIDENASIIIWDPETGDHYYPADSRCSVTEISHLINHTTIWENLQKSTLPHNLKYDVKSSKEWRQVGVNAPSTSNRGIQILELNTPREEEQERKSAMQIEQHLKDRLSFWRSSAELTTLFNRHAIAVLRNYISKIEGTTKQFDRKDLKQLYRAYHIHGFILNLRQNNLDDMIERLASTKIQYITGPVEFAIACHMQRYVGKTNSVWLAVAVLRSRN